MKRFLSIAAFLICLSGCEFIPLYDLEGNVMLNVNYQLEQQVYVREGFDPDNVAVFSEKVHGKLPEHIQVQFYETGTHTLVKNEFLETFGGIMNVPVGNYDVLIYSLGTKATQVEESTLSGKFAYSEMTSRTYDIGRYRNVINEPDHLYRAALENVEILPVQDDINTVTYINTTASSILETWTFEMLDVEGMEYISQCELFITGQEGRAFLWGDREGIRPGALKFNGYPDFQDNRLYSIFNTFGRYNDKSENLFAVLRVTNSAGNVYTFEFDITDQFDDPDNTGHNIVVTQHVKIPADGGGAGGFDPSVNPWWKYEIITN